MKEKIILTWDKNDNISFTYRGYKINVDSFLFFEKLAELEKNQQGGEI